MSLPFHCFNISLESMQDKIVSYILSQIVFVFEILGVVNNLILLHEKMLRKIKHFFNLYVFSFLKVEVSEVTRITVTKMS